MIIYFQCVGLSEPYTFLSFTYHLSIIIFSLKLPTVSQHQPHLRSPPVKPYIRKPGWSYQIIRFKPPNHNLRVPTSVIQQEGSRDGSKFRPPTLPDFGGRHITSGLAGRKQCDRMSAEMLRSIEIRAMEYQMRRDMRCGVTMRRAAQLLKPPLRTSLSRIRKEG